LEGISCRRKSDKGALRREIDLILEMPRKLLIGTPYKLLGGEKRNEKRKKGRLFGFWIDGRNHRRKKASQHEIGDLLLY
jgi:hypothetical protein